MSCKKHLLIIALFILSAILGAAAGALNFLGILQIFSGAIPYIGGIAALVLLSMFGFAKLIAFNKSERVSRASERILCECAKCYLKPIMIAALAVIVASILFISIAAIPILSAFVMGFLATFLFFALFLLAALSCCLVEASCRCKCPCDPARASRTAHSADRG